MHKNLFLAFSMTVGAIVLAFGSGAANAAAYGDTSPIYAGVGVGRTQHEQSCWSGNSCEVHNDASGKVYAGFSFAPMSAWRGSELTGSVELTGYFGGRTDTLHNRSMYDRPQTYLVKEAASFRAAGVGYRLSVRESEAVSLNARIGLAYVSGKVRFNDVFDYHSTNATGLSGGLGASYALGRQWSLNADYDLLRVKFSSPERTNVHMFTLGAGYKF